MPVAGAADDPAGRAAVAAALAVASAHGLRVTEPRVVGRGSNRIVWLRPAPVVARVMTGTAVLHPDPAAWLARELAVGRFLAQRGAPVVAPASGVDCGPHRSRGQWLSLWEHVEVVPARIPAVDVGRSLRALHDALASYPDPLPPRSSVLREIDWLLATLGPHGDLAALRDERDRLAPLLDGVDAGGQALHGDASIPNLLPTAAGPRWNDLEDVCCGSRAWDLVGLVDDARDRYGDAFAAEVLRAYGGEVDPALAGLVRDVQDLYGALWRRYRLGAGAGP